MKKLNDLKREICEYILNMDSSELYNFVYLLQEYKVAIFNNAFYCDQCLDTYGDCVEVTRENNLCMNRFIDYFKDSD